MSIAIVDASPLLFLARLNRLELLNICANKVYIPNAVLEEIDKKKDESTVSIRGILNGWLLECKIANQYYRNLLFGLGAGEIDVMVQAYEQKANWVVLDD